MRIFVALLAVLLGAAVAQPAGAQSAGDVSTIAMNAVSGRVAVGMTVELYEVSGDTLRPLTQALTGDDGRATLIPTGPLPLGNYELRFQTADYFRREGIFVGDPAVIDYAPVRFSIADPRGHYHVPLICTPSGYTTYRGS
jgi:hydroxyisourate hydrolase